MDRIKAAPDRIDKIKTLEAIAAGQMKPGSLEPPPPIMFVETYHESGEYEASDGKIYSQKEYDAYFKKCEEVAERRQVLGLAVFFRMTVLSGPINIQEPQTKQKQEPEQQQEVPMDRVIDPELLQLPPQSDPPFTEAEVTNQAAPGEPEKPEVIVDQQAKGRKKPVLLRNITDEFINQFLQ